MRQALDLKTRKTRTVFFRTSVSHVASLIRLSNGEEFDSFHRDKKKTVKRRGVSRFSRPVWMTLVSAQE